MSLHNTLHPTLIDTVVRADDQRTLRNIGLAIAGSLLLALTAHIKIPFWPVPMTMQTFAVMVIGMAYGWRLGMATVALYLAEGAMGLPVFASGAGIAYLMGPTGGYLFGFVLAAGLVGWLAQRGWDRSFGLTLAAMALGTALIFVPGVLWLASIIGFSKAITAGLTPFIAAAAFKILLAAAALPTAWKLLGRR